MFELLDRIRQKPEPVRLRIAVLIAFTLTLIIVAGWFFVVRERIQSAVERGGENTPDASQVASPQEQLQGLSEQLQRQISAPPGVGQTAPNQSNQ